LWAARVGNQLGGVESVLIIQMHGLEARATGL
jgi:hypothetical protein